MEICVFSTTNQIEANMVKNALDENNIDNYLKNKSANALGLGGWTVGFGAPNLAFGDIKIMVKENDKEKALEIVRSIFGEDDDKEEIIEKNEPPKVDPKYKTEFTGNFLKETSNKQTEEKINQSPYVEELQTNKSSSKKHFNPAIFFFSIPVAVLIIFFGLLIYNHMKQNVNQNREIIMNSQSNNQTDKLLNGTWVSEDGEFEIKFNNGNFSSGIAGQKLEFVDTYTTDNGNIRYEKYYWSITSYSINGNILSITSRSDETEIDEAYTILYTRKGETTSGNRTSNGNTGSSKVVQSENNRIDNIEKIYLESNKSILNNTTWSYSIIFQSLGLGGPRIVTHTYTYYFGDGNYRFTSNDSGVDGEIGTFSISNNIITFNTAERGKYTGIIIGNSLTVNIMKPTISAILNDTKEKYAEELTLTRIQ